MQALRLRIRKRVKVGVRERVGGFLGKLSNTGHGSRGRQSHDENTCIRGRQSL